jgi:hypothetical protein
VLCCHQVGYGQIKSDSGEQKGNRKIPSGGNNLDRLMRKLWRVRKTGHSEQWEERFSWNKGKNFD